MATFFIRLGDAYDFAVCILAGSLPDKVMNKKRRRHQNVYFRKRQCRYGKSRHRADKQPRMVPLVATEAASF